MTKQYQNEDWLQEKYISDDLTQSEISDICDVTRKTVGSWLDKFNISKSWEELNSGENNPNHTGLMCGEYDESWLAQKYCDEGLTQEEIANLCDTTRQNVGQWLSVFDIPVVNYHVTGEDNSQWNGGVTPTYGNNWRRVSKNVRERDGYACQSCGMTTEEHHEKYGRELDVHHIIRKDLFDRWVSVEDGNVPRNLITLCRSCHTTIENDDMTCPKPDTHWSNRGD